MRGIGLFYVRIHGCMLDKDFDINSMLILFPAATEPNPRAGRPRQEPGAHHTHLPMDGTWVPIETVTLSKFSV